MKPPSRKSIPQSITLLFPKDILLLREFKALLNGYIRGLGIARRFRPRLYTYADYILVKFYALATDKSTEIAAEKLNRCFARQYQNKFQLDPKQYCDGIRHRRFVPHQTDVDKFFRMLTLKEIQYIFGNLLMKLVVEIRSREQISTTWKYIADNSAYAYYGKPKTTYEIGTHKKQGTRICRLIQGHAIYTNHMTLFTSFNIHEKGKYRARFVENEIKWLRFNGIRLSYILIDREFYRAALVKDLKMINLPLIMPAMKHAAVIRAFEEFLRGNRELSAPYLFAQTQRVKPYPTKALVHLVIIGNDEEDPVQIRKNYNAGRLSFQKAFNKLAGFFVTGKPWQNLNRWRKWLVKAYKQRWNIETGFAKLNAIHESFRNKYPLVFYATTYMRGFIYNSWQHFRSVGLKNNRKHAQVSLTEYKPLFADQILSIIKQSVRLRSGILLKSKKEVYFQS